MGRRWLPLVLLLLCPAPALAQHEGMLPDRNFDERNRNEYRAAGLDLYTAFIAQWRDAWNRDDATRLATLYADNATLQADSVLSGRQAIESFLRLSLATRGDVQLSMDEFEYSGNLMYVRGLYFMRGSESARGAQGQYYMVLQERNRKLSIRLQLFIPQATS